MRKSLVASADAVPCTVKAGSRIAVRVEVTGIVVHIRIKRAHRLQTGKADIKAVAEWIELAIGDVIGIGEVIASYVSCNLMANVQEIGYSGFQLRQRSVKYHSFREKIHRHLRRQNQFRASRVCTESIDMYQLEGPGQN